MSLAGKDYGNSREKRLLITLIGLEIFGILCCIVGIILLSNFTTKYGYEIVQDYTDCLAYGKTTKCKDVIKLEQEECSCYIQINITKPMESPVTIYYELESYDQISSSYGKSRDDHQLAGHLSPTPSASCGDFTYVNTTEGRKPIAPCGALADAMFNDTLDLYTNNTFIKSIYTGLISEEDKASYHNPEGNLEQAFKSYAKPINWVNNIWELDTKNPQNNGFQNEAFIAWMKTDWKRKPAWRVNHTGLYEHGVPEAVYTLRVKYRYPPSRYSGPRKFVISSVREVFNSLKYGFGIALLVIGLLLLIITSFILWKKRAIWRHKESVLQYLRPSAPHA